MCWLSVELMRVLFRISAALGMVCVFNVEGLEPPENNPEVLQYR